MTGHFVVMLLMAGVVAGSADVTRCYNCFTTTARSNCHVRPQSELNGRAVCPRGTKRCVTERHQNKEGGLISLTRRCATELESRFSYNRCDNQTDGTARCTSYCKDPICNRGTGRLYTATRFWNHDSPDYADYVFDPEQAVLDPNYGSEARRHTQDEEHTMLGGGAGGRVASVVVLLGSVLVGLAIV